MRPGSIDDLALARRSVARGLSRLCEVHRFEIRYAAVEKVDWNTCRELLDAGEKSRALSEGWSSVTRKLHLQSKRALMPHG